MMQFFAELMDMDLFLSVLIGGGYVAYLMSGAYRGAMRCSK